MNLLEFFDYATASTAGTLAALPTAELSFPTPCSEWDGTQLLSHLFAVNGQAKAMAAGGPVRDPMRASLAESYAASVAGVRAAFADPAAHTAVLATPMGPYTARVVLTVTSLEHLVHGWDLATASGTTVNLDPVAVGYA